MMIGIMGNFLAAAKFFRDSESVIVFLIIAPCVLAFALLPIVAVLQAIFPDKLTFGFNYPLHAKEQNSRGYTSEQLAEEILSRGGISYVRVVGSEDEWGHSFDPDMNAVVLSKPFYGKKDMRSICAAIHECGHAMQHNDNQPAAKVFGSKSFKAVPMVLFAVFFALFFILKAYGKISAGAVVIFMAAVFLCLVIPNLIRRPYEHDASKRAVELLEEHAIFDTEEINIIRKMLRKQWHDPPPSDDT